MVDKVVLYNIALNALLIDYQTTDPDNDNNKAVRSLRTMYPLALAKVLADLDLNRSAVRFQLELTAHEHPHWEYVYKYPTNCAKLRRLISGFAVDNFNSRIPFATETISGVDCICTNEAEAWAEIQSSTTSLSVLNPNAAIAIGFQMAYLASALIAGKASRQLKQSILQEYTLHKSEAMEDDLNENVDSTTDEFKSEFVQARIGGYRWPSKT